MQPLIELKNINMVFSKRGTLVRSERYFHVLRDVNLEIHEKEIIAVIGESGCGKTTLGRIITGLLKPTSGDMRFMGKNVYTAFAVGPTYDQYRRSVQFVQQDSYAALNPLRTIRQSLEAPIKTHNKSWGEHQVYDRMKSLLETVGLSPVDQFLNKYPHQLSGGQRQRILMARALSMDPQIIVADEPVSMIDVSLRLSILKMMNDLNKRLDVVFVYITHDLATARYIARGNRIAVMYLGEIVEIGPAETIIQTPRHPYTRALISAVPIPDPELANLKKDIPIKNMEMEDLERRGKGCPFHIRCPFGHASCLESVPYVEIEDVLIKCSRLEHIPPFALKRSR